MIYQEKLDYGKKEEPYFSIHTLEMRKQIPFEDFFQYKDKLFCALCNNGREEIGVEQTENCLIFRGKTIYERGINRFELRKNKVERGFHVCQLVICFNLRKLFGISKYAFISIIDTERLGEVESKIIKTLVEDIGIPEELMLDYYFSRIDYCCNIDLGTEDNVHTYIRLLRKGRYYDYFKEKKYCHGREYNPDKEYILECSGYEIAIYSKYDQLEDLKKRTNVDEEEYQKAKGQLRIEFRAKRDKLKRIENNNGYDEDELIEKAPIIGMKVIEKFLTGLIGKGDFYKLKEVKARILKTQGLHEKTKREMINICERVCNGTSWINIGEMIGKDKFLYLRKKFDNIGVSPICIPAHCKTDYFHNPVWYIQNANVNQR